MLILEVDTELAGHLATALEVHRRALKRGGFPVPPELAQLVETFTLSARQGQPGTAIACLPDARDDQDIASRTASYAQAAHILGCSVRQVKRLTATRQLPKTRIGGLVRIQISDIDTYLNADHDRQDTA
jgi:excisionase family DNA binding protein